MFCPCYVRRGLPLRKLVTMNPPMRRPRASLSHAYLPHDLTEEHTQITGSQQQHPWARLTLLPGFITHERDSPIGRTKIPTCRPTDIISCNTLFNWAKEMPNDPLPWAVGPTDTQPVLWDGTLQSVAASGPLGH
jgi:hypothetical protein